MTKAQSYSLLRPKRDGVGSRMNLPLYRISQSWLFVLETILLFAARLEGARMLLKYGMGNGEWGMGNGEWGMGIGCACMVLTRVLRE